MPFLFFCKNFDEYRLARHSIGVSAVSRSNKVIVIRVTLNLPMQTVFYSSTPGCPKVNALHSQASRGSPPTEYRWALIAVFVSNIAAVCLFLPTHVPITTLAYDKHSQ